MLIVTRVLQFAEERQKNFAVVMRQLSVSSPSHSCLS